MTKMSQVFTTGLFFLLVGFSLPGFAEVKIKEIKKTEITKAVKAALKADVARMDIGECNKKESITNSKKTILKISENGDEALSFDNVADAERYPAVRKDLVAAFSNYLSKKRGKEFITIEKTDSSKGEYLIKVKDSSCKVL